MGSRVTLVLLIATACMPAHGAGTGYAAKAVDLLERPVQQAKVVTKLAKRQPVEILGRNGSWARAKSANGIGWVRLADLRLNTAAGPLTSPPTRAKPTGKQDTAIRGFSEEELTIGAPNRAEGEKLQRLGVPATDAVSFARAGNLKSRQQDYLQMQDYMPEGGFPESFFDE
jgi:hypothetical protein